MFFIGNEAGDGILLEILWEFNPINKAVSCSCQIRTQKHLSYQPIKLAYFYFLPDHVPILVTETVSKTGEHLLMGYRLTFDIEFVCKCDMIRLTIGDRSTRYVNKEQFSPADKKEVIRQYGEIFVNLRSKVN